MPLHVWAAIGLLAAFSLAWMLTLVPFSKAFLQRRNPGQPGRLWRIAHASAWLGLIVSAFSFLGFPPKSANDLTVIMIVLGGIGSMEVAILCFGAALGRAEARRSGLSEHVQPSHPRKLRPPLQSQRPQRGPGMLTIAAATIVLAWLVQDNQTINAASAAIHDRQTMLLWIIIPLAAIGYIGCMTAMIRLLLSEETPMAPEEIDAHNSRTKVIGSPFSFRLYRFRGHASGIESDQTLSFNEIKAARKSDLWRTNPHWRNIYLLLSSGLLMGFGLFSFGVVIGPPAVQIIMAATMAYAATRLVIGWVRS